MPLHRAPVDHVHAPPSTPPLIDSADSTLWDDGTGHSGAHSRSRSATTRPRRTVAAVLLPLQLFLAAGWLRAGVEKVIDPAWWRGDTLLGFLDDQRDHMLPFFRWFSDTAVAPIPAVVAFIVAEMQLAIAICLLSNRYVRPALWSAIVLNVTFTLAGAVNPSAFYIVMQVTLLLALSRPVSLTIALRRAALWCIVGATMVPFVRAIDPASVIDDPAAMLSFVAVLAAAGTLAPHRRALTELALGRIEQIGYVVNRPLRHSQMQIDDQ
ncbi:MAG: hypothetical protein AAGF73_03225 [Actinomycetota bacterium]